MKPYAYQWDWYKQQTEETVTIALIDLKLIWSRSSNVIGVLYTNTSVMITIWYFLVVGSTSVLCSCIDMNSKSNGMFFILILPLHAFGCGHRKRRFGGLSPTSCDHFVLLLSYVIHSSEGHMHLLCPDRPDNLKRLGHNLWKEVSKGVYLKEIAEIHWFVLDKCKHCKTMPQHYIQVVSIAKRLQGINCRNRLLPISAGF